MVSAPQKVSDHYASAPGGAIDNDQLPGLLQSVRACVVLLITLPSARSGDTVT